jgi:hypothetical protein
MRYFHRTSLSIEDVISEADRYFGGQLQQVSSGDKTRTFSGAIGVVTLSVRAEGGHYTLITVSTDQMGESELDKLSKRFLTLVHKQVDPRHVVRGAY